MLNAIPNPSKSFQIDRKLSEVKSALKNLCLYTKEYKLFKENDLLSLYTYEASEFLSVGAYIDVNASSVNEDKTDIKIEVRRKVGSFNHAHEVNLANNHIVKITDLLSTSLTSDHSLILDKIAQENELKRLKDEKANEWAKNNPVLVWLLIILGSAIAFGLFYFAFTTFSK